LLALMFSSAKKKTFKRWYSLILKTTIVLVALGYLMVKLSKAAYRENLISYFDELHQGDSLWLLVGVVLLMPLNWFIEVLKWKLLICKIEHISITKAISGVLAGTSISILTPNRIGEFFGRVIVLDSHHRVQGSLMTVLGSLAQLIVTLLLGGLAYLVHIFSSTSSEMTSYAFYVGAQLYVVLAIVVVGAFLSSGVLSILLSRSKFLKQRYSKYIGIFELYRPTELFKVLKYSLLRYLVYGLQLFLMLQFFQVHLSIFEAITTIPLYFLTLTSIPSVALAELGIREALSIGFFSDLSENIVGIVAASFFIWLINLMIPAIMGGIVLIRTKIFS
jgi:hypothetical protein